MESDTIIDESTALKVPEAPAVPKGKPTRQMVEIHFTDALCGYYGRLAGLGTSAAEVILCGAMLVRDFELSAAEFSALLKDGEPKLGSAKDALLAGSQVPIREIRPVRGEGYTEIKAHPYKQHGRVWRQLSYWQAALNTSQKDVDEGKEVAVATWPTTFLVNGTKYSNPAEALLAGNGLHEVHVVFANVIRPQILDLSDLSPQGKKGRLVAAVKAAQDMSVTVRVYNKTQNREAKKTFKLSEMRKMPEAIYGAAVGVLGMAYVPGQGVQLDPDDKAKLIEFLTNGTVPNNIPAAIQDDTENN